jgi:hypothetical protein
MEQGGRLWLSFRAACARNLFSFRSGRPFRRVGSVWAAACGMGQFSTLHRLYGYVALVHAGGFVSAFGMDRNGRGDCIGAGARVGIIHATSRLVERDFALAFCACDDVFLRLESSARFFSFLGFRRRLLAGCFGPISLESGQASATLTHPPGPRCCVKLAGSSELYGGYDPY